MKLGLLFENSDNQHYFGFSRFVQEPYFEADVKLTPEVERAVSLVYGSRLPIAMLDVGNHGNDMGLTMIDGKMTQFQDPKKATEDFETSEITARISFGGVRVGSSLDFSQPARLHIAAYARRHFFPEDYESLPVIPDSPCSRSDERDTTSILEEVAVSLSWQARKSENWSDPKIWVRELNNHQMDRKRFDELRTTYCRAQQKRLHQSSSSSPADPSDIRRIVEIAGRRKSLLPLSPSAKPYSNTAYEYTHDLIEAGMGNIHVLPIIGYYNVRRCAGLPAEREVIIESMSPMQGVNFLFETVVPKLKEFISS